MRNIAELHSLQADKSWGNLYYHVIPEIINRNKLKRGIELGVAFGGHAEFILKNTGIEKLYGVDYYHKMEGSTDNFYWDGIEYSENDYANLYNFTTNRLSVFKDRFEMIREKTDKSHLLVNEELDFIFIDALHTYDGVLSDLKNWYGKIKEGGIISGHDYNHPNFPGVTRAVDEFCYSLNKKMTVCDGHVWYFVK
jgi:hypothetical protein